MYPNSLIDDSGNGFATDKTISSDYALCQLFNIASNLRNHPSLPLLLPATTLTTECYYNMFFGCSGLTTAPSLSAETMATSCYSGMFTGCTSLTAAPSLPAESLAESCYQSMFNGCTSLTAAPELKATTLVNSCYMNMFYGCTKLASVKCLAKLGLNNSNCIQWLHGVAASGTFTKSSHPYANWQPGENGIPTGWNVQEE